MSEPFNSEFDLCGCLPEEFKPWLVQVLEVFHDRKLGKNWDESWSKLVELIGPQDELPYWAVLAWFDMNGWIEHGGNISGSWLTDVGADALNSVRADIAKEQSEVTDG